MSRGLGEPGHPLEIGNDGDASQVEGVLTHAFVARLGSLDLVDTRERVLHGGAFAEVGAAIRAPLVSAQGLQERFLRMDRDGAAPASRGRARGA